MRVIQNRSDILNKGHLRGGWQSGGSQLRQFRPGDPPEQIVLLRNLLIDPDIYLIVVSRRWVCIDEIAGCIWKQVGWKPQLGVGSSVRLDEIGRDDVAREHVA